MLQVDNGHENEAPRQRWGGTRPRSSRLSSPSVYELHFQKKQENCDDYSEAKAAGKRERSPFPTLREVCVFQASYMQAVLTDAMGASRLVPMHLLYPVQLA